MTNIPSTKEANCLKLSSLDSSFINSGRTVTRAMCRNPPAVKGSIQEVLDSMESLDPNTTAIIEPIIPAAAVQI